MIQVRQNEFSPAEFTRRDFNYIVPKEHAYEDLLRPEYWAHVISKITQAKHDRPLGWQITATREDAAWQAEFIIISVTKNSVFLRKKSFTDLQDKPATESAKAADDAPTSETEDNGIKIQHVRGGWRAVRKADNQILIERQETRDMVESFLKQAA
jgi:hypothetical protein